jgi:hypothetical protein
MVRPSRKWHAGSDRVALAERANLGRPLTEGNANPTGEKDDIRFSVGHVMLGLDPWALTSGTTVAVRPFNVMAGPNPAIWRRTCRTDQTGFDDDAERVGDSDGMAFQPPALGQFQLMRLHRP